MRADTGGLKKIILCLSLLTLGIFVGLLVMFAAMETSFNRALRSADLHSAHGSPVRVVHMGIDSNGYEYKIVTAPDAESFMQSQNPIVHLRRSALGFWRVYHTASVHEGRADYSWSTFTGERVYAPLRHGEVLTMQRAFHRVIVANTATGLISLPIYEMPNGVTISVMQQQSYFVVHITAHCYNWEEGWRAIDKGFQLVSHKFTEETV